MKYYGRIDDYGDRLVGGGSWNEDEQGSELYNFKPIHRALYGFVRSGHQGLLALSRIDDRVTDRQSELRGVTVIFVATDRRAAPDAGRQRIVGWYRNATVYRASKDDPTGVREGSFL